MIEQRRGRLMQDFRLRTPDAHYLWFALKARPVVGSDGEVVRIVGTADRRDRIQEPPKSGCCTTRCTTI